MKEAGASAATKILCLIILLYGLSVVPDMASRWLLPVYAYGGNGEVGVWEEAGQLSVRFFLPVYGTSEKNPVKEKRKDVFQIKTLEKGEMLTLMELENSSLGHAVADGSEAQTGILGSEGSSVNAESVSGQGSEEAVSGLQGTGTDASGGSETGTGAGNGAENGNGIGSSGGGSDGISGTTGVAPRLTATGFLLHEKVAEISLSELSDYDTLVKRFYTIDAITTIGADELNAEKLGSMDLTMKQTADAPQILIYHTHSQEGYADSVPGDDSTTIIGVGEHLKEILEQQYGYNVLHHTGKYDVETRDNAYSRSLPEIQKLLEENPTIEVIIDLHRDGVADESTKLVTDIDGRPTAQFMFFNGISRTKNTGKIDYLYNENLETNLAFSFQMKWKAEEYYPGLTRRNYLNAYRYNMHLRPKTLLLELGAQTNTLEEAMNACDPIAHILHIVLSGE